MRTTLMNIRALSEMLLHSLQTCTLPLAEYLVRLSWVISLHLYIYYMIRINLRERDKVRKIIAQHLQLEQWRILSTFGVQVMVISPAYYWVPWSSKYTYTRSKAAGGSHVDGEFGLRRCMPISSDSNPKSLHVIGKYWWPAQQLNLQAGLRWHRESKFEGV